MCVAGVFFSPSHHYTVKPKAKRESRALFFFLRGGLERSVKVLDPAGHFGVGEKELQQARLGAVSTMRINPVSHHVLEICVCSFVDPRPA